MKYAHVLAYAAVLAGMSSAVAVPAPAGTVRNLLLLTEAESND